MQDPTSKPLMHDIYYSLSKFLKSVD